MSRPVSAVIFDLHPVGMNRSVEADGITIFAFRRNATLSVLAVAFLRNARCCGDIVFYQTLHPYGMRIKKLPKLSQIFCLPNFWQNPNPIIL